MKNSRSKLKCYYICTLFILLFSANAFAEDKPQASKETANLGVQNNQNIIKKPETTNVAKKTEPEKTAEEKKDAGVKEGVHVDDIYAACKYYFSKVFNTKENTSRKNICNGYFFGSASMLLLLQDEGVQTDTCMPMDISTEEVIKGFLSWADKNQDKNKMLASEALLQMLRQSYPCNEYKPPEKEQGNDKELENKGSSK